MNAVMEKIASRDSLPCARRGVDYDGCQDTGSGTSVEVYKHMRAVLRAHRRDSALKNNVECCCRDIRKR